MAVNHIRAVAFDLGGTLEELSFDDALRQEATSDLQAYLRGLGLDAGLGVPALHASVVSGMKAYQAWREASEIELPPERVWTEYILADHGLSKERLSAAADDLALFYETHYYARRLRPEAPAALEALREQGFRLAIVSNVMSRRMLPTKLAEYGIAHYFDPVVASVSLGWRKPNARIFEEAARLMHLPPAACAYVGDTVSRDVIGARRAGYGLVLQIRSSLTSKADFGTDPVPPDAVIADLMQVVPLVSSEAKAPHGH